VTSIQTEYQKMMETKRHNAEMERLQDAEVQAKYGVSGAETLKAQASKIQAETAAKQQKLNQDYRLADTIANYISAAGTFARGASSLINPISGIVDKAQSSKQFTQMSLFQ